MALSTYVELIIYYMKPLLVRYNEKVLLECELAELRRERNVEWEKTKHHLKLAKSKTSFEESLRTGDIDTNRDSFV